jgi:signal recognition particle subunit SRP72
LERFDEAAKIYEALKSTPGAANEANDLRIHTSAIDAQLEWSGMGHLASSRKPQKDDMQAFERAYNTACACIAREEFGQAEVLLNRAKRM